MLKIILIVHSISMSNFWSKDVETGFRQEAKNFNYSGKIKSISLLDKGKKNILEVIKKERPSMVILNSVPACSELLSDLMKMNIPTVFSNISSEVTVKWLKPEYKNVTGIFSRTRVEKSLEVASEILGNKEIKNVGILIGGPDEAKIIQSLSKLISRELSKYKVTIRKAKYFNQWKEQLRYLDKNNDILIPLIPFDMENSPTDKKKTSLSEVNKAKDEITKKPTIGTNLIQQPINRLVTMSMKPEYVGQQTAQIAYQYLVKGIPLNRIPYEYTQFHELNISKEELKRLDLTVTEKIASYANIR